MILGVKVKPDARESRVVGWEDERTVIVAVAAPPVEGKANAELVRFVAKALGLPRSSVTLERGATARVKHLSLPDGTSLEPLKEVVKKKG